MAEGKVNCVDEAVIEKSLTVRHTEVKEGTIARDFLWFEDLIVVALGIVVTSHELVGLLLLELLKVSLLGGLAISCNQTGISQVLLGDIELLPKLSVAVAEIAEESDPIDGREIINNTGDSDPSIMFGTIVELWCCYENKQVHPDLLTILPFERNPVETSPVVGKKKLTEVVPRFNNLKML
jgi:hypothetical protein